MKKILCTIAINALKKKKEEKRKKKEEREKEKEKKNQVLGHFFLSF